MLPFLCMFFLSMASGKLADKLIGAGFGVSKTRKLFNCLCLLLPACFLMILLVLPADQYVLSVIVLILGQSFFGMVNSGYVSNFAELSAQFSGTLMAVSNTTAQIPGIMMYLIGVLLDWNNSWFYPFLLNLAICIFGVVIFTIFGQSQVQF